MPDEQCCMSRPRTLLESRMVLMRCAMVSTVQSLNSRRMVFWISESVSLSTLRGSD